MEESLNKAVLVKPIEGMNQYDEALSLSDSEFSFVSGTYPSQKGIQSRIPGKVLSHLFASSVLSITDFLGTRLIQTSGSGLFQEDALGNLATLQIAANTQSKNRDCFAVSNSVQLCVRSNGEERTKVIDLNGNIFNAEIPTPPAPTAVASAGGTLAASSFYGYAVCYVASTSYPFVQRTTSINGKVCPRGNPNTVQAATTASNKTVTVSYTASSRADIDKIWIFRTTAYSTFTEANNATNAGLLYFIQERVNATSSYADTTLADGVDQIEKDNFSASSFKNVVYFHPYWIGFGKDNLKVVVTWNTASPSVITLVSGSWYDGRNLQPFKLTGITTGGIDGKGTFLFKWTSNTTANATIDSGGTLVILPAMGGGTNYLSILNDTAVIYRSKAYDPFSWGWTRVIGTSIESMEWTLDLDGGNGTAIAVLPNESILKVDTESPTKSYAFNLQLVDNYDQFKQSIKIVSLSYSVSSQASQFSAQTKQGNIVLWGFDYKNFAILQSDGISTQVISDNVQNILRDLTTTKADQIMCHGIYEPYTQCNCMWITLAGSPSRVHYMIYQHVPTGFWGVLEDLDVLCSAQILDTTTGQTKILLGTESGLYGQGFVQGVYQSWSNLTNAIVTSSTTTVITASASTFTSALIGCWLLVTNANDQNEQWARISAVGTHTLTVDRVFYNKTRFATLQITPTAGFKLYIGLIECRLDKYFDFKLPNTDKKFQEIWISQQNTGSATPSIVRIYREFDTTTTNQFSPKADFYKDTTLSTSFIEKRPTPTELIKSFRLQLINREFLNWTLRNMVLKFKPVP